jgi:hypothetical protein
VMMRHQRRERRKELKDIILMRNQMAFALENLWSYFHLDVLESQWIKLKEVTTTIREFDELRRLLEDFLKSISKQIFLNSPEIVKQIYEIVEYSRKFLTLLKT